MAFRLFFFYVLLIITNFGAIASAKNQHHKSRFAHRRSHDVRIRQPDHHHRHGRRPVSPQGLANGLLENLFKDIFGNSTSGNQSPSLTGVWSLAERGVSGVSAQQMAVVDDDHVLIIDKVEFNPLTTADGKPAWASLYTLSTGNVRPLTLKTNSFCAGGSMLGNGTMVSIGGNDAVYTDTLNNTDGRQSLRLFTPCGDGDCEPYEDLNVHSLLAVRWYPTTVRMVDGSILIIGGCHNGGYINDARQNEATLEYFPRKSNKLIPSKFLNDTLFANLFPFAFTLPSGEVFMAANTQAMIYDPTDNTERRLPDLPNGVRVSYPMSGSAVLLPLTLENAYTPEVLICGGADIDDTVSSTSLTSQVPASKQCSRMALTEAGIAKGWVTEDMPFARHMHSMVMLPTGQIVIVNGAETGVSSYQSVQNVVGNSNADHPVLQPVLYDYTAPAGSRFSTDGIPASKIARMYHSAATVTPSGEVMISGSNPNPDVTYGIPYPSEYSVEILSPPYVSLPRPVVSTGPSQFNYDTEFEVEIELSSSNPSPAFRATLLDPGFSTHGVQMDSRLVVLEVTSSTLFGNTARVNVRSPPSAGIYPPGIGFLYIFVDGVPSVGKKVLVGDGSVPTGV